VFGSKKRKGKRISRTLTLTRAESSGKKKRKEPNGFTNPKQVKAFNGEEKQYLESIPISILNPKEKKSKKRKEGKKRIQFGFEKKSKGPRHLNSNPNWVKEWMKRKKRFRP